MSGAYLEQAARVTDGISHTGNDFAFGLSIVFLVGGGLLMAPLTVAGAAAVIGTAGFAQGVGKLIDRNLPKDVTEHIARGAATVFMDEPKHPAAMAAPTTNPDVHSSDWVCTGSDSVLIERCNASRISDTTTCAGTIVEGSTTIFTGGVKVLAPGAPASPSERVGSDLYQLYDRMLMLGGYAQLPRTAWQRFIYAATAANDLGIAPPGTGDALLAEGARSHATQWTQSLLRSLSR